MFKSFYNLEVSDFYQFKIDEKIYKSDIYGRVSEWLVVDKEGDEIEPSIYYKTESGEQLEVKTELRIVKNLEKRAKYSSQCIESTKKGVQCQNRTLHPTKHCWRHRDNL